MSTPVVVQGTPVANPHVQGAGFATSITTPQAGQKQAARCNDPIFALLFYVTVIAMVAVSVIYGPSAMESDENGESYDYSGYVTATVIVVCLSFLASGGALAIMMCIPETLIKVSLIFVVVLAGLWMVMAFLSGQIFAGIMGAIFFAMSLCYAKVVWGRIPFATANLVTSMTAIKANLGVTAYAYLFTIIAGVWSILWSVSFVGIYNESETCDARGENCEPGYGILFVLFVAFFFVQQVLSSCVHTTVAGTVGNWWFEPAEANSCCSSAVNNSFLRTVTTSFGSICFGSLIVAILEALRMLARAARENDDGNGILLCIAECILGCLSSLMEYFNKWAFIYVGLYGYSYLEAGKNVFTLFHNRGWEAIIADDLVQNVLFLMSLMTGGVMGGLALIMDVSTDLFEEAGGDSKAVAFLLGFIVGLAISSVLLSTVGSGVNAVIVLFAEAPADFERNHPQLSQRMRTTWNEVYPGSV
ncbi:hypothetical protein FisN_1Hh700 [Fistulifera solaris]|uniref:Choline transporter-like protein n=1 Tax=Fistulifera solaris TaxID=1519565 RepID=A0A1Z5JML2_FISSO|nr:hypothetical protein FisN_1Hh700 [Fistulifera solaris]|eukprot:GAX15263.1 hypothetical protein FisN_1Hh700 [Fistulifera solaris]